MSPVQALTIYSPACWGVFIPLSDDQDEPHAVTMSQIEAALSKSSTPFLAHRLRRRGVERPLGRP
jgi:hypothetical protein